jgi:hypothetical protein
MVTTVIVSFDSLSRDVVVAVVHWTARENGLRFEVQVLMRIASLLTDHAANEEVREVGK